MNKLLMVIFLLMSGIAQAQTDFYYYQSGRIYLEPVSDRLAIKFFPGTDYETKLDILRDPIIKAAEDASQDYPGLVILETVEGTVLDKVQNFLNRMRANDAILTASSYYETGSGQVALTDEIIVRLHSPGDYPKLESYAKRLSLVISRQVAYTTDLFVVGVTKASSGNAAVIAAQLHESGVFAHASPNFLMTVTLTSNDPLFADQWALKNTGANGNTAQWGGDAGADIDGDYAWNYTTGEGIIIAILDEGVQANHPDLNGRVLNGFNAINGSGSGHTTTLPHGTSCAGLAAATKDNNLGIAGVAPDALILPIIVSGASGSSTPEQLALAFDFARCEGADVISCSFGVAQTDIVDLAINRALTIGRRGNGAVILASTGNGDSGQGFFIRLYCQM